MREHAFKALVELIKKNECAQKEKDKKEDSKNKEDGNKDKLHEAIERNFAKQKERAKIRRLL